ncbi:MAG TPA: NAD(P)/FAD-dependent oxidoreductase [Vicinamibacterales bacterium]|nr:NAD(P)/FAD-dependent oxidoreductase [Vicinamibacterales bacterium]
MKDLLIIGAGHNGLVAAFYLAKAGFKPLVLESRDVVGGCVANEEFGRGFKAPVPNALGPLRASVVRDMDLARTVQFIQPDPRLVTLAPGGRALAFSADTGRTSEAIRAFSEKDAAIYPDFCATLQRLGAFIAPLLEMAPPDIDSPAAGEMWDLLKLGKRFRSLGRKDSFRLLRWGPMAAADLVAEWFETDLLQAGVAARGVFGTAQGPWSAGSGAVLLLNAAADPAPGGSSTMVKGGPGALAAAMADAARSAGAELRTGARVARILVREGQAAGVVLESGEEILAPAVISNADPRRTFLDLVDPVELDPGFLTKARNYRARGTVAKVHLALAALPTFNGVPNPVHLHGRIQVAPGIDYLERAFDASKYGELPGQPYLDISIPTLGDTTLAPSGKQVMSIHVQFVPYHLRGGATWETGRDTLATIVLDTLEQYAPGLRASVEAMEVLSPVDLERRYGLTGGQIYHGEPALDQLFTMRPILGWSQYGTPIENLFLCGSGTHPGGGITGASGQNAAREIGRALKARRTSRVAR